MPQTFYGFLYLMALLCFGWAIYNAARCLVLLWRWWHGKHRQASQASRSGALIGTGPAANPTVITVPSFWSGRRTPTFPPLPGGITYVPSGHSMTFYTGAITSPLAALADYEKAVQEQIENAGVTFGEIIAWRGWVLRVHNSSYRLCSVAAPGNWKPGIPMHDGDALYAGGGVHAWKTKKQAATYMADCKPCVIGRVALWGEVIEHELGYRAEFAKPYSFDIVAPNTPGVLEALRQAYGIKASAA